MQNSRRLFFILSMLAILISGCQPAGSATVDEPALPAVVPVLNIIRNMASIGEDVAIGFEQNECLKCHSSQARLIETGDPVEATAESESKGVG